MCHPGARRSRLFELLYLAWHGIVNAENWRGLAKEIFQPMQMKWTLIISKSNKKFSSAWFAKMSAESLPAIPLSWYDQRGGRDLNWSRSGHSWCRRAERATGWYVVCSDSN